MLSLSITGFWIIFWFIPKLTECRIQDKFVTIARCRSVCLDSFSSNKDCDDKECSSCWHLCQLLIDDALSWSTMCTRKHQHRCTPGCRTACDSTFYMETKNTHHVIWRFTKLPEVTRVLNGSLQVTWTSPMPEHSHRGENVLSVIYILFKREKHTSEWTEVAITTKHETNLINCTYLPHLRLVAVTSEGVIAECYKSVDNRSLFTDVDLVSRPPPYQITKPLVMMENILGVLQVRLTLTFSINIILDNIVVQWERIWYDTSLTSQNMTLNDQLLTLYIPHSYNMVSVLLPGVTFNSDYRLSVYITTRKEPIDIIYFYTEMCLTPDVTFTLCDDDDKGHSTMNYNKRNDFKKIYLISVSFCVFLLFLAAGLCVTLLYLHLRWQRYMKKVLKKIKEKTTKTQDDMKCRSKVNSKGDHCYNNYLSVLGESEIFCSVVDVD